MIDLFLFCDLAATHISVRGDVAGDEVLPLVRVIDLLPAECTVVLDLRELGSLDDEADSMLRAALESRTADRIVFHVSEPVLHAA